jgi:hypothetical protein
MSDVIVTNPVVEPVVTPTTPIVTPVTPPNPAPAKTFSQEDVDNIVTTRLAKERAKYLKKFGVEDDGKLDEVLAKATAHDQLFKENADLKAEKLNAAYEKELTDGLKVDGAFLKFALTQIDKGKTIDEFRANAKAFIAANPKMLKEAYTGFQSGPNLNGTANEAMPDPKNTEAYLRWRNTHNPDGSLIRR